ncbi:MAG: DUF6662 family protein [Luteolibacter sp.]|uniref:DUF6662 family protein n=1 Tax=Luteolibacter sp. TaxID=1962973 RepID=UPI0032632FD7
MTASTRILAASLALTPLLSLESRADENLFGWAKGTETLPKGHIDLYQFTTMRTGKANEDGSYNAYDFETEVEYGYSDELQLALSVAQNYFSGSALEDDGDGLTQTGYRFGGVAVSGKYRFKSPFIDGYGLALIQQVGYNRHDETAGIVENHVYLAPTLAFQKNFLDNTLITVASVGVDMGWGKKPAEEYSKEMGLETRMGVSYRFAPNWFVGLEGRVRSEYPQFDITDNEHVVVFVGPNLHYASEKFWATLGWAYQAYGHESDGQQVDDRAFAEQVQNEIRLKVGFNF